MLFRNFFANYEASEGGIVSLLSGVPPLHFPTASTNTFAEYALQRGITESFKRRGYRCEFLTSVPLQFISMDAYARSPNVGLTFAGGQHEIPRMKDAPHFAFESPADHVLYEELLERLDSRAGKSTRTDVPRGGNGEQSSLLTSIRSAGRSPRRTSGGMCRKSSGGFTPN